MKLTDKSVQAFACAELATFDLSSLSLSHEKALGELSSEIVSEFNELNQSDVQRSRCEYFAIDGACPNDFSERFLDLGDDRFLIYGIRHMGGDKDLPFVQLRTSFTIVTSEEALTLYDRVMDEFTVFSPLFVSFWSSKKIDVDFIGATYLVTKASDIQLREEWPYEENLELREVIDDSFYDWYREGYEIFHRESPDLKEKVTVNSLELMKASKEEGLLKEVFLCKSCGRKEKIGLIAAERVGFLGHSGVSFLEIFIDQKWRGRGLAKAMQRKFVGLFADDEDLIWGTIDELNLASFKTAFANGRRPIRYECFVKVCHLNK